MSIQMRFDFYGSFSRDTDNDNVIATTFTHRKGLTLISSLPSFRAVTGFSCVRSCCVCWIVNRMSWGFGLLLGKLDICKREF